MAQGMNCNPAIVTNNSVDIFTRFGINCTANPLPWWATNQPGYVSGSPDPNHGECLGYNSVPGGVLCGGSYPTVQRICRCDAPSKSDTTFGTGLSAGAITQDEQWIFQHFVAPGDVGVMTHFWFTIGNPNGDGVLVSYYIDGEETPSIEFSPSLACGVGFNDTQAPWGNKWFGKGANDNSYFWNYRVPFQKSIAITARHTSGSYGGFYMIVRGSTNVNMQFGGVAIPSTAKLNLFKTNALHQALDWVTLASVPSGMSGVMVMHTLSVLSGDENFMEGCYHMYSRPGQGFPGTVISTGTEDYFDSGWYFNAGPFHIDTAGLTHFVNQNNNVQLSAYRVHEADPLTFNDGFQFVWRVGDTVDASGIKCLSLTGNTAGSPMASSVIAYVWVYTWQT